MIMTVCRLLLLYQTPAHYIFPHRCVENMSSGSMEQNVILESLVKLQKLQRELCYPNESNKNNCLSRTEVFERFKIFKKRHDMTKVDSTLGRIYTPKTNVDIQKLVNCSGKSFV